MLVCWFSVPFFSGGLKFLFCWFLVVGSVRSGSFSSFFWGKGGLIGLVAEFPFDPHVKLEDQRGQKMEFGVPFGFPWKWGPSKKEKMGKWFGARGFGQVRFQVQAR